MIRTPLTIRIMDLEVEPMEDMRRIVEVDGRSFELNCEQAQTVDCTIEKIKECDRTPFYIFVSGPAGSGKTLLLKHLRNEISQLHGENSCLVTASTLISAQKLDVEPVYDIFPVMKHKKFEKLEKEEKKELQSIMKYKKVLLIDVINSISATTLTEIDFTLRDVLGKKKPFGGLSVIVFGDLLQMSPMYENPIYGVIDADEQITSKTKKTPWRLFEMYSLCDNERTPLDNRYEYSNILEKIRCTDDVGFVHKELLKLCSVDCEAEIDETEAVEQLHILREAHPDKVFIILVHEDIMVEEVHGNTNVGNPSKYCPPVVEGVKSKKEQPLEDEDFDKDCVIDIVVGCQVMLTRGLPDKNLLAGAFGIVKSFEEDSISVQFTSGSHDIERCGEASKQFPLLPADAMTIEDCQGIEVDGVVLIAKESWSTSQFSAGGPGHIYTALSRAKSLDLCRISPKDYFGWKCSKSAIEEIQRMENGEEICADSFEITHLYLAQKM